MAEAIPYGDEVWLSSDQHHKHKNLLHKFQPNRKAIWNTLDEMTEGLIERHNEVVKPEHIFINLGDFSYASPQETAEIYKRLNGKGFLVKGNHDRPATNPQHCGPLWGWIKDYHEMDIRCRKTEKAHRFCLLHFRMDRWHWMGRKSLHAHGHVHSDALQGEARLRRFDVGCDANDCRPVSAQNLIDLANATVFEPKEDEY